MGMAQSSETPNRGDKREYMLSATVLNPEHFFSSGSLNPYSVMKLDLY